MIKKKRSKTYMVMAAAAAAATCLLGGCGEGKAEGKKEEKIEASSPVATVEVDAGASLEIPPISPGDVPLPKLEGLPEPEAEPAPEYLRSGVEHPKVAQLQQRLMDLGFMDNDEPTQYFGPVTEAAVKSFQRQNQLSMDGIVGTATWDAIMDPAAKYYAVSKGVDGEDIKRIQTRLYELGYLAEAGLVTGHFGDTTEEAVIKLQEVNGLAVDGKAGRQTINLLYSDEVRPNYLSYGEKSQVVLAAQKRLKHLGYLTTTPDGAYGQDTTWAVKQFQSRNDLVVDGYLGPSTRIALNGSSAIPNGLVLGERGGTVEQVQKLLNKYGYLSSGNITGYYGEMTEHAVKSFQSQNGLGVDGSVGMQTMNKLTGNSARRAQAGGGGQDSGSTQPGSSGGGTAGSTVAGGTGVSGLLSIARSNVGRPYVYGAKGPNKFDCSGFVYHCLNKAGVRQSYLTSAGWRNVGKYQKITSFSSLKAGDIVVVKGHVGIVAGGGQVVDASSSHGRVVERSLSSWWAKNFICGWRIFG